MANERTRRRIPTFDDIDKAITDNFVGSQWDIHKEYSSDADWLVDKVIIRFKNGVEQVYPDRYKTKTGSSTVEGVFVWGWDGEDMLSSYRGKTERGEMIVKTLLRTFEKDLINAP